jgi:hypothetical protein
MQGIQFAGTGVVVLFTVLGGSFLPYMLLYVVRRRQRAGCWLILPVVVLGAALGFLLGGSLRVPVEAQLAMDPIQSALDDQCGRGTFRATVAGFQAEPYFAWFGEDVSCHYLDGERRWECYCDPENSP